MSDKPIVVPKAAKGPAVERYEFVIPGRFNGVVLPVVPHTVTKVTDAGKGKLEWRRVGGQQIVGSRRFVAPVVVEYITDKEHARWHKAQIDAAAKAAAGK